MFSLATGIFHPDYRGLGRGPEVGDPMSEDKVFIIHKYWSSGLFEDCSPVAVCENEGVARGLCDRDNMEVSKKLGYDPDNETYYQEVPLLDGSVELRYLTEDV